MTALNITATIAVKGEYKLTRRKAVTLPNGDVVAGDIVEETPWCKNVLTLGYFNTAFATTLGPSTGGCVVGTGNSAPAETNTALDAYVAVTHTYQTVNTWNNNWTASPRYARMTKTFRFAQGAAAGNIAEVGIINAQSGGSSSSPLLSRALVVDGGGVPTTITVLSDEFLDVTWQCTWYVPEDVAGSFNMTIDGVVTAFNYVVRAAKMANTGSWAGNGSDLCIGFSAPYALSSAGSNSGISHAIDSNVIGPYDGTPGTYASTNNATSFSAASYVADSKQRAYTLTFGLDRANIAGGIGSIFVGVAPATNPNNGGIGGFQITLDPKVVKVNTKQFTFTFLVSMANVP